MNPSGKKDIWKGQERSRAREQTSFRDPGTMEGVTNPSRLSYTFSITRRNVRETMEVYDWKFKCHKVVRLTFVGKLGLRHQTVPLRFIIKCCGHRCKCGCSNMITVTMVCPMPLSFRKTHGLHSRVHLNSGYHKDALLCILHPFYFLKI